MYPSKDWSTSFQCAFSSGESAIVRLGEKLDEV